MRFERKSFSIQADNLNLNKELISRINYRETSGGTTAETTPLTDDDKKKKIIIMFQLQ